MPGFVYRNEKVGIGQLIPEGVLHTAGGTVIIQNNGAGSDLLIFKNGTTEIGGFSINSNGSGLAYNNNSDARLKTNIFTLSVGLNELLKIQPREFLWKNNLTLGHGFIAQELYKIYPKAVTKPESEEGTWRIDQTQLIPILVKSIQDQQKIIDELKERITNLENNK